MGIALLSAWAAHDSVRAGRLVQVLPDSTSGAWGTVSALYPPAKVLPRRLTAFLAFLDDELAPAVEATLLPVTPA